MRALCVAKILRRHAHFRCLITRQQTSLRCLVLTKLISTEHATRYIYPRCVSYCCIVLLIQWTIHRWSFTIIIFWHIDQPRKLFLPRRIKTHTMLSICLLTWWSFWFFIASFITKDFRGEEGSYFHWSWGTEPFNSHQQVLVTMLDVQHEWVHTWWLLVANIGASSILVVTLSGGKVLQVWCLVCSLCLWISFVGLQSCTDYSLCLNCAWQAVAHTTHSFLLISWNSNRAAALL